MTFLPVVQRELRVAARRSSTYWIRSGAGGVIVGVSAWVFLMMQREAPRQLGMVVFTATTAVTVLYCLLAGVRTTADCLSQEKRDGTLGLLFLTDLRGYDVVLGKMVSSSMDAVYTAIAAVPVLAIPLLMGGVTVDQFWRMALVALNALFFSLCVGMLVSSMTQDGRRSMGMTFLVILIFTALLPALGGWVAFKGGPQALVKALFWPSIGYSYFQVFNPFGPRSGEFWLSMMVVHLIAWGALALAALVVPYSWQDRARDHGRPSWRRKWEFLRLGKPEVRAAFRRELLEQNTFFWLAARVRFKPAMTWAVLGMLGVGWFWGLLKFERDWLNEGIYVTTGVILNMLLKGWVASEASRQLADERQQGTLELLLSTPLGIRQILDGQRLALQRQFLGPFVLVMLVEMMLMAAGLNSIRPSDERLFWGMIWLGSLVLLPADLVAGYWVGMWQALTASSYTRAARNTVFRVLILPWIVFFLVLLLVALASMDSRREPSWQFLVLMWFLIGIGVDLVFGVSARQKLLSEFRTRAAARYEPRQGFWQRLFR